MSIRPEVTILPRASIVAAVSPVMFGSTAAILPAAIATSRTPSSPTEGSMTRPPLMIRSKPAARALGTRAQTAAPAAADTNWRRVIIAGLLHSSCGRNRRPLRRADAAHNLRSRASVSCLLRPYRALIAGLHHADALVDELLDAFTLKGFGRVDVALGIG